VAFGETVSLASNATSYLVIQRNFMASQTSIQVPPGFLDPRIESLPPPPPAEGDFSGRLDGVIIPVWAGDLYLAKACCASVRQSMGDIPITVLVDGAATDTRELERLHGVQRMAVQEVAGEECVRLCAGTSWTKLLLFWMSPYERFLCLDADTVVWGDVRLYAEFDQFDFIAAYHRQNHTAFQTPEEIQSSVFDVDAVLKLNPALNWRGKEFANCGVFFARRGVFSEAELMDLRRMDCWRCYEQGLLNYLRWSAMPNGFPRMGGHRIQLFPAEPTCQPTDRFLPRNQQSPLIIHWMGKKPKLGRPFRAANDHRKLFLKMTSRLGWLETRLFIEDVNVWLQRQRRSLRRNMQRIKKTKP
jgi:hypothetical protein